jgi:hypothetical protein
LLKATLLMAFYTVRSERLFCEQLGYNLLFRWFLGLSMVDEPFAHSTFSFNRKRLLKHDVAGEFFRRVVELAKRERLMSDEHFAVDGTLIEAWASLKSFRSKGEKPSDRPPPDDLGNPSVNFRGESAATTRTSRQRIPSRGWREKGTISEAARKRGYRGVAMVVAEFTDGDQTYRLPGSKVTVTPCVQETRGVPCVDCRLCLDADRLKTVIGFAVHGQHAGVAKQALVRLNLPGGPRA